MDGGNKYDASGTAWVGRGPTDAEIADYLAGHGITMCPTRRARLAEWRGTGTLRAAGEYAEIPCYVVAVEPGQDYRTRADIRELGFDAWLPEAVVRRRDARRDTKAKVSAPEPIFPGYLFVPFDKCGERWEAILKIDGVTDILRKHGGTDLAEVPAGQLARFKQEMDQAGGVLIIEEGSGPRWKRFHKREQYEKGQSLRMTDGPFAGFSGLYVEPGAADRIKVLLDIMGTGRVIDVSEAQVEPVLAAG